MYLGYLFTLFTSSSFSLKAKYPRFESIIKRLIRDQIQFKTSQMPVPVPDPVDADTSTDYTGPPPRDMIASHSLTDEIIARHNDQCPILGPSELILLNNYVHAPAQRLDILQANGMLDVEGSRPGSRAHGSHGSLVGYAMAIEYFDEQDITKLKDWFGEGHADQRMKKGGWKGH
ncbi:hypothetical protein H2200_002351 [Cladophialophora chaetospira]|uniref:Uncharacterized protein n=1 Tax=Cladophialophora chaetospira TaxID=386627 RepID=A0AA38XIQ2_9EURO|nr:hypothetical protein H2200_002351 [Cladophialophora chaetospira]